MDKQRIRKAIDANLSGMNFSTDRLPDIFEKVDGKGVVKRKASFALILVIVLLLVAFTAMAVVLSNAIFEKVIVMEDEKGAISQWSLTDKMELIRLLQENGANLKLEQLAQLSKKDLSDAGKEKIATQLLVEQYGREDAISHLDIVEQVKGPMETWSLEDKAWYSQVFVSLGKLGNRRLNVLPGKEDLLSDKVIQIAADAVASACGISKQDILSKTPYIWFFKNPASEEAKPCWLVEWNGYPMVLLNTVGEVIEDETLGILTPAKQALKDLEYATQNAKKQEELRPSETGIEPFHTLSPEGNVIIEPNSKQTGQNVMNEHEAVLYAMQVLIEKYEITDEKIGSLVPYVRLVKGYWNKTKQSWDYWYRIDFGTAENPQVYGVVFISDSGEVLETYEPNDTTKNWG